MRKLREVLRLRFELKLGYQQIGRSCAIAVSTVHKYLKRAEAAGVTWPLPEDWEMSAGAVRSYSGTLQVPHFVLQHRAVLDLPDGTPISTVTESYTAEVLAFAQPKI